MGRSRRGDRFSLVVDEDRRFACAEREREVRAALRCRPGSAGAREASDGAELQGARADRAVHGAAAVDRDDGNLLRARPVGVYPEIALAQERIAVATA